MEEILILKTDERYSLIFSNLPVILLCVSSQVNINAMISWRVDGKENQEQ